MSINCYWKNPLGTCYSMYDEKKEHPITIYGGGNVAAVFCNKDKNLQNYICDKEHFKNCNYRGDEYQSIKIYGDRKREAKALINMLIDAGFSFEYIPTSKGIYNENGEFIDNCPF